jgi:uncharacterized membrane protein
MESSPRVSTRRDRSRAICAGVFVAAGLAHFVAPQFYRPMMPPWLPAHDLLILLSGIGEVAGGIGLMIPRVRVAAAYGLIALLIAVFPANIQMLINAIADGAPGLFQAGLWLRLPLQLVLIRWVWKVRR